MKIGVYSPYLDTLGGGEKYILTACECLSGNNEVTIFWDNKKIKQKAEEKFNLDLSRVGFARDIFSFGSIFQRLLQTSQFDVIIYLSNGSIPFVLARKLILHFQFPVEWVKESIFKKLKFLKVSKVICNSNFTKDFIDKKFCVKSQVVYPPVDLVSKEREKTKKENIILTVGRYQEISEGKTFKKHEVMIDLFKTMYNDALLKNWKMVLLVNFQDKDTSKIEKLEKSIFGYPIKVVKNASYPVLWEYYRKSRIYWHAAGFGEDLKIHPELAEHFGISTVEAASVGSVPVVINAGGQKEIVENGKNGFLWNTLSQFQERTIVLVNNNNLWEQLSNSAKETARNFGKDRFCKELNNLV